jgi:hypothetical protein
LRRLPGHPSLLLGEKARYNGEMRIVLSVAVLVTFGTGTARADEPRPRVSQAACSGPSIELEPPLSQRRSWQQAVGDTRKRMTELEYVDACAHLEVQQTGHAARVRASAADGRSVVRDLTGPSELEPIVVALLVLPPDDWSSAYEQPAKDEASTTTGPAVPPRAPATKPAPRREQKDETESSAQLGTHGSRGSSVELALAPAGRSAGYLTGPGAGAIVDWVVTGWLVGATVHGEQLSSGSSDAQHFSAERTASLGFLFGRRLVARPFYLDVALEAPVLAVRTSKWTSKQSETSAEHESEPGELEPGSDDAGAQQPDSVGREHATPPNADLRAGLLVRGVVPLTGHFGATLGADAERSLGVLSNTGAASQPAPLDWNFGLSLGLFWSGG